MTVWPPPVTATRPRPTNTPNTPLLGPAKNIVPRTAIKDGIVYVTDVTAAGSLVTGVPISNSQNVIATYPIAVVKAAANAAAAQAFITEMVSGTGQHALLARGFLAP